MIKKVIAGEKIERPKLPKPKTVENEGTDPSSKYRLHLRTKKVAVVQAKFQKIQTQEAESKTLHQILSIAYGVPTARITGPETLLESRYENLSPTADQSVQIAIPTSH